MGQFLLRRRCLGRRIQQLCVGFMLVFVYLGISGSMFGGTEMEMREKVRVRDDLPAAILAVTAAVSLAAVL